MEKKYSTLGEFIIRKQQDFDYSTGELSRLMNAIKLAAKRISNKVNKAGLMDIAGAYGSQNIQGEDQQKLDVIADEIFIQTLIDRDILCGIASEENDNFISICDANGNHGNKYVLLMDPLDG